MSIPTPRIPNLDNWIALPPDTAPVNQPLLRAAKTLLRAVYTSAPYLPDCFPNTYADFNASLTAYVVHAAQSTSVVWPEESSSTGQLVWVSVPGNNPAGWSGTVLLSGYQQTNPALNPASSAVSFTDCSGFITALFTYANNNPVKSVMTEFVGWRSGIQNGIPEAGCDDPKGGCQTPSPANYYRYFAQQNGGFSRVELNALAPGDLIAWANTGSENAAENTENETTGHVMLVAAVADVQEYSASPSQTRLVVVIDQISGEGHTLDSRGGADGLGLGLVALSTYDLGTQSSTGQLQFYWKVEDFYHQRPQQGMVALGRANTSQSAGPSAGD